MSLLLNLGNSITAGTDPYQFYNFRERVLADGATVLSDTQVSDEIKRLRSLGLYSKFSALYTPAVRNTSKLYSIISADGDATVTRGSVKNINSATGTLEEIASDVTPSSFGTGGWGALVEGARTNLLQRTEEFDNGWTGENLIITANVIVAPDGTMTADKIIANTATGNHYRIQTPTTANATVHTISVYAKAGEYNFMRIEQGNNSNGGYFNLSNGTVVGATTYSPRITDAGNGWYRCSVTVTSVATNVGCVFAPSPNGTTINYTGDGTSGIFIWGAQLEVGSFASSYIKNVNTSAGVPRSADVITKTGASDLIGQTEGTLFAVVDTSVKPAPPSKRILTLDNSSNVATNRIQLIKTTTDEIEFIHTISSTNVIRRTVANQSGIFKICGTYTPTEIKLFVNGVQISTTGIVTGTPVLNQIGIGCVSDGTNQFDDRILLAGISKTALTQAEAIALTT
jgi:hypothetical protein